MSLRDDEQIILNPTKIYICQFMEVHFPKDYSSQKINQVRGNEIANSML